MSDVSKEEKINDLSEEKVISLFKYIEELNKLNRKTILKISDYKDNYLPIDDFSGDELNIEVYYRNSEEDEEDANATNVLLSVRKPKLVDCPKPPTAIKPWLRFGWEDYNKDVAVYPYIVREESNPSTQEQTQIKEKFEADTSRVKAYKKWLDKRNWWKKRQLVLAKTMLLFKKLYDIYTILERESETYELVVADGFVRTCDGNIDHPVLTRRVRLKHDAFANAMVIEDTDVDTELYSLLFQNMNRINLNAVNSFDDVLKSKDFHPLNGKELSQYLNAFANKLSSSSVYSENGVLKDWEKHDDILVYRKPCYILRKRIDGTIKTIEQIIKNIKATKEVPAPILDIVNGGIVDTTDEVKDPTVEEQLAAVGGESIDVLLSKEANKEQLEIAQRIERYNAVLVQGPPGTGKTHTIANLMGHFLAQGKSVLVTSHTKKALKVLKDKVAPGLQSLCVSMLEDSNEDMEKSVDGISDYMTNNTSFELKKEMIKLKNERIKVMDDLAKTRRNLFNILCKECSMLHINDEDITPAACAEFVQINEEKLSYIPGKVRLYTKLPLTYNELADLYKSNGDISIEDENEFENDIPNPIDIMDEIKFEETITREDNLQHSEAELLTRNKWTFTNYISKSKISIKTNKFQVIIPYPTLENLHQLMDYIENFEDFEEWMKYCAVDGKKGKSYRERWINLIDKINETSNFTVGLISDMVGKTIEIKENTSEFREAIELLRDRYKCGKKVSKVTKILNKKYVLALSGATINGHVCDTVEDCELILNKLKQETLRNECGLYWNELMASHQLPRFNDLDSDEPENIAKRYIPSIERYLKWFEEDYQQLRRIMEKANFDCDIIFQHDNLDSDIVIADKILNAIKTFIYEACKLYEMVFDLNDVKKQLDEQKRVLRIGKRNNSSKCKKLVKAINDKDINRYQIAYTMLKETYAKIDLQVKRNQYLNILSPIAPQWAEAIRNRVGKHGEIVVPNDIEDAWKWKQYYGIIEEMTVEPFMNLQNKSLSLSKEYRKITALYAEKCAWYNLMLQTENDLTMRQALQGWKQTVKKIGKGTGKNAPMYRAKARELMAKCQHAVPGWIMPINKALESLNPCENKFDVIIIDEASQSNISSLAILYMGKKLIIVGDDKQVSPMGIGVSVDKIKGLREMYIEGKIPNDHLYDAKTSIYDIAATTFQPLMLREHFRCVPDIIGFSNDLSYDGKIKPLRDSSNTKIYPPVVDYHVIDGKRDYKKKVNHKEANSIVALMKACFEQEEYKNKTFGVISLLGDNQVTEIQRAIDNNIDSNECEKRQILCGNASNFQGDERDVIFLSMVDSNEEDDQLRVMRYGTDDSNRKRYNVAASRAKDQLWVVHSLDSLHDLKEDDIRKRLIEYASNPASTKERYLKDQEVIFTPFESKVNTDLRKLSYHLENDWHVGTYNLKTVAMYGNKKVAIECNGESYNSNEENIREDMEKQTILERLGWTFIRIRSSEYYRNADKTMEKVIKKLNELEIYPETNMNQKDDISNNLLERIKNRANEILNKSFFDL